MPANEHWQPDWATHPGEHLAEYLEERAMSQADFARVAGMTPKLVSTIVNGENPVTPDTAIKLERVLGLKAGIWLGIQKEWDLKQARQKEETEDVADWIKRFPLQELRKLGRLPDTHEIRPLLDGLLDLLGIGSPSAYKARVGALAVQHRRSAGGATSLEHEVCWLMLAEEKARLRKLPAFNRDEFQKSCQEIRTLTVTGPEEFEPKMRGLCSRSGVALVFQKPISKTCLFGAARWIDGDHPLIQMSLRMRSNDHFWWTFFHEAAHIVLHKGKNFADDQNASGDGIEAEADAWAEETLVGHDRFRSFLAKRPRSRSEIVEFADRVGVHPGIVVGMLQHHRVLPFSHLNELKAHFIWADEGQSAHK